MPGRSDSSTLQGFSRGFASSNLTRQPLFERHLYASPSRRRMTRYLKPEFDLSETLSSSVYLIFGHATHLRSSAPGSHAVVTVQ
jgi:hypothetical protein